MHRITWPTVQLWGLPSVAVLEDSYNSTILSASQLRLPKGAAASEWSGFSPVGRSAGRPLFPNVQQICSRILVLALMQLQEASVSVLQDVTMMRHPHPEYGWHWLPAGGSARRTARSRPRHMSENVCAGYNLQNERELLHWDFLLIFTVDQDSVSRGETAAAYVSCHTPDTLSICHDLKVEW